MAISNESNFWKTQKQPTKIDWSSAISLSLHILLPTNWTINALPETTEMCSRIDMQTHAGRM